MPLRVRPTRAASTNRASNGELRPDNRLASTDQAFFDGHRAAGQKEAMQACGFTSTPSTSMH